MQVVRSEGDNPFTFRLRGGDICSGIVLTIHQEWTPSTIDFAELTCPVPGTGEGSE